MENQDDKKPNLFHYATKELSQDAIICWLIKWSEHDGSSRLAQLGRQFVESLLNHKRDGPGVTLKGSSRVEIYQQQKNIDVLARIDGKHILLIEDKINGGPQGDPMKGYLEAVLSGRTKLGSVSKEDLFPIYLKTGNHSLETERWIEDDLKYKVFNRINFLLSVLNNYDGNNAILLDFRDHLVSIEDQTQSFRTWKRTDCAHDRNWYAWQGLYRELESRLFGANSDRPWRGWGHVNNQAGGFMGFWWRPAGPDDSPCTLQLEYEKLCFKVNAWGHSSEGKKELKWYWNEQITNQDKRVIKPPVMRQGNTMTVAIHEDGWLRYDDEGVLSLDRTVEALCEAERILLAAELASRGG